MDLFLHTELIVLQLEKTLDLKPRGIYEVDNYVVKAEGHFVYYIH